MGAEALRGGLTIHTTHRLGAGSLRLRTLVQMDGDTCTTIAWPCTGGHAPWPRGDDVAAALDRHRQRVDRGVQPLNDRAILTSVVIGCLSGLLTLVLVGLELVLTGPEEWLSWVGAVVLSVAAPFVLQRLLSTVAAIAVRRSWRRIGTALGAKEDRRRDRQEIRADRERRGVTAGDPQPPATRGGP